MENIKASVGIIKDKNIKDASHGHLLGSGLVISHLKNSHVREEKEKKKLIGFLKLIPSCTVAT